MTKYLTAAETGIKNSAAPLTTSLRKRAQKTDWKRRTANTLKVTSDGKRIDFEELTAEAHVEEYGDSHKPPKPAVRHWAADHQAVEQQIVKSVTASLKGLL